MSQNPTHLSIRPDLVNVAVSKMATAVIYLSVSITTQSEILLWDTFLYSVRLLISQRSAEWIHLLEVVFHVPLWFTHFTHSVSAVVPPKSHWTASHCSTSHRTASHCSEYWCKTTNLLCWPDLMADSLSFSSRDSKSCLLLRIYICYLKYIRKLLMQPKLPFAVLLHTPFSTLHWPLSSSSIFLHLALLYKYWLPPNFSYNELQYSLIQISLQSERRPLLSSPRALSLGLWSAYVCWLHGLLF